MPAANPALRDVFEATGYRGLGAWARAAGLYARSLYMRVHDGKPLSGRQAERLAAAANLPPSVVRTLFRAAHAHRRSSKRTP